MKSFTLHLKTGTIGHLLQKAPVILGIIMVIGGTQFAKAQPVERTVTKGERVKIKAPTVKRGNLYGRVAHASPDVLTIATKDSTYALVYASIEKLSVYAGKKRSTGKGALIGAGIGVLVLGTIAATSNKPAENTCDEDPGWFCDGNIVEFSDTGAFFLGGVVGGLLGAAGGSLIGSFIHTPRWEEVPVNIAIGMPPLPAYATQNSRSFNAGISLRFSLNSRR